MANIIVKYLDEKRQFNVENKPVILKYLVYLFEQKMNISYYENVEFKVNDKVMYSGNKLKLDSMIGFNLVESNKYELIYY
jgi:hypothetical protein|nr:MAG TPA: hypothetical protein [Caudoviricetes sp.]